MPTTKPTTDATCPPCQDITRDQWESKKRHGYTSYIHGVPYILTMGTDGATCLMPVRIIAPPKTRASRIEIRRAEGRIDECARVTIEGSPFDPEEIDLFRQANGILAFWATTAPKGGCYDKCDFTVTWADGETYQGRYDLKHKTEEPADLAAHILSHLRFYAGEFCPAHLTEEQYREFLAMTEKSSPGNGKECADYLRTYQIGSEEEK